MRRIVTFALMCFFANLMPSAHADQVVIEGFATLNYPTKVKLKSTGCQEVLFNYVTDDNLPRENTVFFVAITPTTSRQSYGYAAWMSKLTYKGQNALPAMARIGTLRVKVCRKAFMYSSQATKKTPGINPGTYRLFFDAGYLDSETGEIIGEKIEIARSIKFY